MNPEEYHKLFALEREHWYYKGKRKIVQGWIRRNFAVGPDSIFVDIGAGSGLLVREMSQQCRAFGVEFSELALSCIAKSGSPVRVAGGSALQLPLRTDSVDIVTCLDVIEHIKDDKLALQELIRVTKRNGIIVITVPAFMILMGDWDKSLGHFRRYHLKDFRDLYAGQPVSVLVARYINTFFFFPVLMYRILQKIFPPKAGGRLEDVLPPSWANAVCHWLFTVPDLCPWFRLPFGLSALIIFKKL